jgi:hypothetical protein
MSDSDVLEQAAQALRTAHTGERQGSGFTRARIMGTLHRDRRRRVLGWAIVSPLVSVLLVGSAWAQSAGKWPVVWAAVTSVFVPKPSDVAVEATRPRNTVRQATPEVPAMELPSLPVPVDVQGVEAPSLRAPVPLAAGPKPVASRTSKQTSISRRGASDQHGTPGLLPTPDGSEPSPSGRAAAPAADPELASFRAAHDLHFQTDRPRQAITAYAAYLKDYPNGRFVPEARYNTALNWIKLGDKAAARRALRPFASGTYGEYRRAEAQQLLEALR